MTESTAGSVAANTSHGSAASATVTPPMFELRDVVAGYGESEVLHGVSLQVPSGSTVALLGPNGAGKTTLLRAASGLLRPSSGTVLVGGEDVTKLKPYQLVRRGVCHIPESRGVYPSLTVRENLVLHTWQRDADMAVNRAVEYFPILGQKLTQLAGNLSGGQQQMLAVVRSYIAEPRLVLVDEVSMGLAPVIVDQIYEFLAKIVQTGTSLLLVEQYVSRALQAATRVVILTKGRVVFDGSPGDVKDEVFEHYLGMATAAH
jgi:branched-chain amino acid transport system ATP-binding protein